MLIPASPTGRNLMNLADARSYFDGHYEQALADPAYAAEQRLTYDPVEDATALEAFDVLVEYVTFLKAARKQSTAASTLGGVKAIELLWDGPLPYGKLFMGVYNAHRRGASRSTRQIDK